MNKEELEKLINKMYYEYLDTEEAQKIIDYIKKLEQENKILKENAEHNDKVVDKVNWGNQQLKKENQKYKEVIDKAIKCIDYNTKYRNGADIYQFVDIESEILESLKFILELDEENGNAYLKEFNDWLKEVE